MTGKPTCLAEERWLTGPFMYTAKSPLDRINDCLLVMMTYVSWLEARPANLIHQPESTLDDQSITKLSSLMGDLDDIWSQISHWEIRRACDDSETDQYSSLYVYTYTNAHQANSAAIHGLARLILLLLLDCQTSPMGREAREQMMVQASASILSAATYLSTFDIGCAYLRIITPLQIVAQRSPNSEQRDCAVHILQQWWAERPLKGLAWKALQTISFSYNSTLLVGN